MESKLKLVNSFSYYEEKLLGSEISIIGNEIIISPGKGEAYILNMEGKNIGSWEDLPSWSRCKMFGDKIFVCSERQIKIYNLKKKCIKSFETEMKNSDFDVDVENNKLYTTGIYGISVYDLDAKKPEIIKSYESSHYCTNIKTHNNCIYYTVDDGILIRLDLEKKTKTMMGVCRLMTTMNEKFAICETSNEVVVRDKDMGFLERIERNNNNWVHGIFYEDKSLIIRSDHRIEIYK